MRKIELDNEVEVLHKKYFEYEVKNKLNKEIKSTTFENIRCNGSLVYIRDRYIREIKKRHKCFVNFIKREDVWSRIAVGKPKELRNIKEIIKKEHNFIYSLLNISNRKIEVCETKEDLVVKLSSIYSNYLLAQFKYNTFSKEDYLDALYNNVTLKLSKKRNSTEEFMEKVIKDLCDEVFPKYKTLISNKLECIKFKDECGKCIDRDKLKIKIRQALKEIDEEYNININMGNLNKDYFKDNWNGYIFAFRSKLRVCPYCNREYITPVYSPSGKMRAVFDHFYPKEKYPYFSLSLYNLIPCCGFCNSSFKGRKEFSDDDINPYESSLDDYAKFSFDINNSSISFISRNSKDEDKIKNYNNMFKLNMQYNYHNNYVNEFIQKRYAYTEEFIKNFYEENKEFFRSEEELREVIVGFKIDKRKINNEPLGKFRRDLAEELGFFKDNIDYDYSDISDDYTIDDNLISLLEKLKI